MRLTTVIVLLIVALTTWAKANPTRIVEAEVTPSKSVELFKGCSFACATDWKLSASSSLPAQGGVRYDVSRLDDVNEKTCWASRGAGEWCEAMFPGRDSKSWSAPLRGFRIINGYAKTPELWKKNARVRTMRMDHNGKAVCLIRLEDSANVQSVILPELKIHKRDRVRFTIVDVYPGTAYKDTCISEMIFDGGH